jgi:hypothetical protein
LFNSIKKLKAHPPKPGSRQNYTGCRYQGQNNKLVEGLLPVESKHKVGGRQNMT